MDDTLRPISASVQYSAIAGRRVFFGEDQIRPATRVARVDDRKAASKAAISSEA